MVFSFNSFSDRDRWSLFISVSDSVSSSLSEIIVNREPGGVGWWMLIHFLNVVMTGPPNDRTTENGGELECYWRSDRVVMVRAGCQGHHKALATVSPSERMSITSPDIIWAAFARLDDHESLWYKKKDTYDCRFLLGNSTPSLYRPQKYPRLYPWSCPAGHSYNPTLCVG